MDVGLDKLVKVEDRLERLIDAFVGHPCGPAFRSALSKVDFQLARDLQAQQARFLAYEPVRPADEPHDAGCQVTRYGADHCCTCKSNSERTRMQIINAGKAGDLAFRSTLGSMAQFLFDDAARGVYR